jgi:methylglutaconyl-CoA hydratase
MDSPYVLHMEFRSILYSAADRVARITLNRADHQNTLDDATVNEMITAVGMASRDPGVKVLHLASAGNAFCAGVDPVTLERLAGADLEQHRTEAIRLSTLLRSLYEARKPVIAIVSGPALGVGCGLACACDFVLAARDAARFGCPEVHMGIMPALVALFLSKRVGEGRAREIILGGESITATEAQRMGLVTACCADDKLNSAVAALTDVVLHRNSGTAMGMTKELFGKLGGMNMAEAVDFATNMNAAAGMTAEARRGVQEFLNNQQPEW